MERGGDSRMGKDWPGWGRTTVSGVKVQRPAIRRRAIRVTNLCQAARLIKSRRTSEACQVYGNVTPPSSSPVFPPHRELVRQPWDTGRFERKSALESTSTSTGES